MCAVRSDESIRHGQQKLPFRKTIIFFMEIEMVLLIDFKVIFVNRQILFLYDAKSTLMHIHYGVVQRRKMVLLPSYCTWTIREILQIHLTSLFFLTTLA